VDKWEPDVLTAISFRTIPKYQYRPASPTEWSRLTNYIQSFPLSSNKPYRPEWREENDLGQGVQQLQTQGELTWLVGGFVTGGPPAPVTGFQDIWDQQTADIATPIPRKRLT